MNRLLIPLCALLFTGQVHAITPADVSVKCTSPDGKVTYQRGSCPPGNAISVERFDTPSETNGLGWTFSRVTDPMTNEVTCNAQSAEFFIPAKRSYERAQLIVMMTKAAEPLILVSTLKAGTIFHHDIRQTGLKVGDAGMLFFGSRPTQTLLAMPIGTGIPITDSMQRYQSARIRVRFWPWDETFDSAAIPLQGFKRAFALAKQCSASL